MTSSGPSGPPNETSSTASMGSEIVTWGILRKGVGRAVALTVGGGHGRMSSSGVSLNEVAASFAPTWVLGGTLRNRVEVSTIFVRATRTTILGATLAVAAAAFATEAIGDLPRASAGSDHPEWYTHDVLPVAEAEVQMAHAIADADRAERLLDEARHETSRLEAERQALAGRDLQLFVALREAAEQASALAVDTFVAGGTIDELDLVLSSTGSEDASWRFSLAQERTRITADAVREFERLREAAGARLSDLSAEIDQAAAAVHDAEFEHFIAALTLAESAVELTIAQAWERADLATSDGRFGAIPESDWAELRHCESTDNYAAVDPTRSFYGAYQFTVETWGTVGGVGNPADATPEEQDARARILYAERGRQPWPVCGRWLPVRGTPTG